MIGIALLSLLGIALILNITDDDDSDTAAAEENAGDDLVEGTGDADLIESGAGDDRVFAAAGDDVVLTQAGDDRAFGQDGDDLIVGGEGDDFLRGGAGDDLLTADAGNDTLNGDIGNDILDGTDLFDNEGAVQAVIANGAPLTDVQFASFLNFDNETGEADTLNGGVGNDDIIAGSNDVVTTGVGVDFVITGDWVLPDQPVTVTDFDPAQDVMIFNYFGDTAPTVFFAENDDGTATLERVISDTQNQVVAVLQGVDFFDLDADNLQLLQS